MRYNKFLLFIFIIFIFGACNYAKQKTKETLNKTGKTVGKGATEFVSGFAEGVDQTLECAIVLSEKLKAEGLQPGKFKVTNSTDGKENVLTAYLVFDKDFKQNVSVKVFDKAGQEYGRTTTLIDAKAGEGKYFDFNFDKRTDIESQSKFVIE